MSSSIPTNTLTPSEREQARQHWEALLFAPSRLELEKAQLALLDAPVLVRRAVTASVTEFWLRDHEPHRNENPFQ